MGIKTKIEWADSSVNPIMGCTGCALRKNHCYAATLCARYAGLKGWPGSFDQPEFFPGRLEKAARWRNLTGKVRPDKPWLNGLSRRIFINDMSDGFCPDVDPWEWLAPFIPSVYLSPHIWLLLTKWPDRMCKFFEGWSEPIPSNFHLGVSVENQAAADERREHLEQCPAAVKYVSYEPALGPVDWTGWEFVDQIISGGESGPSARPSHPNWHRATRDFCQEHGIAYFFKAWGGWVPNEYGCGGDYHFDSKHICLNLVGESFGGWMEAQGERIAIIAKASKKAAGHLLDGRAWQEFPQ